MLRLIVVVVFFLTVSVFRSSSQSFRKITDWALCNNGSPSDDPYRGYECVQERNIKVTEQCDPRKVSSNDCKDFTVELKNSEALNKLKESIQQTFTKFYDDHSLRRLNILYPRQSYNEIAYMIDTELMSRPLLFVRNETFPWQNVDTLSITVDKYHHGFERRLKVFGATHYPDQDTCSKTALLISRTNCVHPGYASAVSMYYSTVRNHPHAVMAIYISQSNTLQDGGAFIGGGDQCPYLNRWNCAFLPSTTCEFPANITDCRDTYQYERCVNKIPDTEQFSSIYFKGHYLKRDGEYYKEMSELTNHPVSDLQKKYSEEPELKEYGGPAFRHVHPKMINDATFLSSTISSSKNHTNGHTGHHHQQQQRFYTRKPDTEKHLRTYNPLSRDPFEAIFQDLYFLRGTARYRALVGKELRHFAIENDIDGLYGYDKRIRDQQILELKKLDENGLYSAKNFTAYYYPEKNATVRRAVMAEIDGSDVPPGKRRLNPSGQGRGHRQLRADTSASSTDTPPIYRCVAAHMRRGDRIVKELNATALATYCRENKDNPSAQDKGCGSVPFQLITLDDIAQAAMTLVDVREVNNLLVLTDDEEWIINELEKLKLTDSPWRINVLLSPWNEDRNFTLAPERWSKYGRMGLQAGVHFLSSMQVIRNCEGYVGHFASAATHIFYVNMCVQHGVGLQRLAACPPVFDLRGVHSIRNAKKQG